MNFGQIIYKKNIAVMDMVNKLFIVTITDILYIILELALSM